MSEKVYVRVSLDNYIEAEYESVEEAIEDYLDMLKEDIKAEDISVEVWNEGIGKWHGHQVGEAKGCRI